MKVDELPQIPSFLFSCSCFANLLGLNISSGFKSAVTVYILIPLILIPQLVLSGVVIDFDEFNPEISAPDEVPLLGELMASRWGFEAVMVTQFRDNRFERDFYELDKEMSFAEYKTVYYIPILSSKLSSCLRNKYEMDSSFNNQLRYDLRLLKGEIGMELDFLGADKLPAYQLLNIDQFDSAVHKESNQFLKVLKRYYQNKYNEARIKKDSLTRSKIDTPAKKEQFSHLRNQSTNERVATIVKNTKATERIVERNGKLIQKIYPVYTDPAHPDHFFDFRTQFFSPSKHFMGILTDTFIFNILLIWSMTFLMFITIYFDLLRKLVDVFSEKYRIKPKV